MSHDTCNVQDCARPSRKRGMCTMHYGRWRAHGSTDKPVPQRVKVPVSERFWSKVQKTEGCWIWTASTNGVGYGKIHDGEKLVYAHRLSWELHHGRSLPSWGIVDHICHNSTCVRPEHLRLVTKKQNVEHRRGATKANRLGHRNISYAYGKYRVYVSPNGESTHIGSYSTLEEAQAAAAEARAEHFTHAD